MFERASQDARHHRVVFFKFLLFSEEKSSLVQWFKKARKKWVSSHISAYIYIIKAKLNLKKGLCGALRLDALFQAKKFTYVNMVWTEKSLSEDQKIINRDKTKKIFPKQCWFSSSWRQKSSKFSGKKKVLKKKLSFLKDLKTGYRPMHLSQFRNFWRKLTFFWGGGLNMILLFIILSLFIYLIDLRPLHSGRIRFLNLFFKRNFCNNHTQYV